MSDLVCLVELRRSRLLLSLSESALTTAAGIGGGSEETATNGGRSVMLESASSTFLTTGIESSLAGCCFGLGWLTGLSVVWLTWISELGLTGENTESGTGALSSEAGEERGCKGELGGEEEEGIGGEMLLDER